MLGRVFFVTSEGKTKLTSDFIGVSMSTAPGNNERKLVKLKLQERRGKKGEQSVGKVRRFCEMFSES
jgi:hypothetical protein